MENNKISIILTTYNRSNLIGEMLAGVISQVFSNWECIIVDDNSSDDTQLVINNVIKDDDRFQYIKKPEGIKRGLPASRNIGIKMAAGKYVIFFDDDDIIHPQLLDLCVQQFQQNENLDFVHYLKEPFEGEFDYKKINLLTNKNSYAKLTGNFYEDFITGKLALASCTVLWKASLLKENLFNENLMYAEEWECYFRVLINNSLSGVFVDTPLYFNRKHPNSNTGEFWKGDEIRVNSDIEATTLIISALLKKEKLTPRLVKFFLLKSLSLNNKLMIKQLLFSYENKLRYLYLSLRYKIYKLKK